MERTPIDSYEAQHSQRNHRDYEPVANRCWRATARFQLPCHRLTFTWKVGQRLLSRNRAHAPLDHLRRRHAEVVHPSARLDCRRRLHPIEFLCGCSISAEVDLGQTQSCAPVFLRTGGSYPSTAQLSVQTAALRPRCPDWNSQLAELVPTQQKHGCANSHFALERLQLRKTPADMLVTLGKAVERCALRQMPH
jgi:hypothetical protein